MDYDDPRRPCPVCQHPTGDCAHSTHDGLRPLFHEWSDDPLPRDELTVEVPVDVWEDVASPKEARPRRRLVARAGQKVDVATARRIGIMPDDKQQTPPADKPTARPDRRPGSPRDKAERPAAPRDRVEKK